VDGGDIRHVEHRGHLLKYNDDPRGDDEADDVQPHPPHTTINLSDEEKGGLSDKEKGGGAATMVMVTTMTQLNVCDASMEEKEGPSNPSQMHATINTMRDQEQRG